MPGPGGQRVGGGAPRTRPADRRIAVRRTFPRIGVPGEHTIGKFRPLQPHFDHSHVRLVTQKSFVAVPPKSKVGLNRQRQWGIAQTVIRAVRVVGTKWLIDGQTPLVEPGLGRFLAFVSFQFPIGCPPGNVDALLREPRTNPSMEHEFLIGGREFVKGGRLFAGTFTRG